MGWEWALGLAAFVVFTWVVLTFVFILMSGGFDDPI